MDNKIIEELKEVLGVTGYGEIRTKEQFFNLISYMYCLEDEDVRDIVLSIENIELLVEEYFNECIDTIIDYDPSIMVALVDSNSYIMELLEKNTHESRLELAKELKSFSKWLMLDSRVNYTDGINHHEISVHAAITMLLKNKDGAKAKRMKFRLISDSPEKLLKDLRDLIRYGIDFGDTPYLGGDLKNSKDFFEGVPIGSNQNYYLH
ncbi:MAG: hypothetical protein WC996_05665 [Peptostreptococcales bacterium]